MELIEEKRTKQASVSPRSASSRTSVPRTLGSRTRAAFSAVLSIKGPSSSTPAAWKTPSILPNCLRAWSTAACIWPRSVTSAWAMSNPPAMARIWMSLRMRSFSASGRSASSRTNSNSDAGGKRGAADQNQASLKFARQMLGDGKTQSAQASGDDVDASALQTRAFACGREVERFERFNEALAAAPGDGGVFVGGVHLGDELGRALRGIIAVEVDRSRCDSGKLLRQDARRTQEHGAGRIAYGLLGNLLHVVGDESDVDSREILRGQRLREIKRAIEAAIESLFKRRFGGFVRDRTTGERFCAAAHHS